MHEEPPFRFFSIQFYGVKTRGITHKFHLIDRHTGDLICLIRLKGLGVGKCIDLHFSKIQ